MALIATLTIISKLHTHFRLLSLDVLSLLFQSFLLQSLLIIQSVLGFIFAHFPLDPLNIGLMPLAHFFIAGFLLCGDFKTLVLLDGINGTQSFSVCT